jgi:hypothetical protein
VESRGALPADARAVHRDAAAAVSALDATEPLSLGLVGREMGAGYSYIWRSRILRWLLVPDLLHEPRQNNGIGVLMVYVLREENALPPVTIGFAIAAVGVLQILGSSRRPRSRVVGPLDGRCSRSRRP